MHVSRRRVLQGGVVAGIVFPVPPGDWDWIAVLSPWDLKEPPDFGGYDGTYFGAGTAFTAGFAWYRIAIAATAPISAGTRGGSTAFASPVGAAIRPGERNVAAVRVFRNPSYTD